MSGEIIQLSGSMSLIFEANDLSQASVSRIAFRYYRKCMHLHVDTEQFD